MKRDLFAELVEGFNALKVEREGRNALRKVLVEEKLALQTSHAEFDPLHVRSSPDSPTDCS